MNSFCKWLSFSLALSFVASQEDPVGEFGTDTWKRYLDFLKLYNLQYPFRRLILVYSMHITKLDTREATRMERAKVEAALLDIEQKMSKSFSMEGVSVSCVRLPPHRGFNVVNMLRLKEIAPQPPITVALLSPDSFHASFIREVAESGALIGNKVSWIALSFNSSWNEKILTTDLGLRADSTIIAVNLQFTGVASIGTSGSSGTSTQRWNGYQLESKQTWTGGMHNGPGISLELTDYKLSIAVFQDPPFIYALEKSDIRGWFVDVWKDIETRLKFTTSFYFPSSTGGTHQGSLFRRAVAELREGRADVVLGAFVLTEREMDECDFSVPLTTIRYRFYIQRITTQSSESQFIQPFSMRLWYATWGTVAATASLMASSYLTGRYFGFERQPIPIFNIRESILIIYGSLLQQSPDFVPNGLASRIIMWCSFAFGLVVYTLYAAALISSLTIRTVAPPFTNLDSMLQSNYMPYMITDSAVHRVTQAAQKGSWRELEDRRPRYTLIDSLKKGLEVVESNSHVALLAARERTLPYLQATPLNCRLEQLPTNILNAPGSLLLQKNSPFKSAIDQQILQMWNNGRLDRYRKRWMSMVFDNPCPVDASLPQFGLSQVLLAFKIFASGLCMAFFLLFIEVIAKRFLDTQENIPLIMNSIRSRKRSEVKLKKNNKRRFDQPQPQAFLH